MFEAEYARRRTTAEAEAGRICSGDTVYLAGGPLLPVDFAAALHRRAAELHGVRVLNYLPLEPLALLTDPAFSGCHLEFVEKRAYDLNLNYFRKDGKLYVDCRRTLGLFLVFMP